MRDGPIPESDYGDGKADPDSKRLQEVHERGMHRFDEVACPQVDDRAEMLEDRRFCVVTGAMWEGPFGELFENSPRPEVDLITKNKEKIEEDYRQNRIMVDYLPGDGADPETADLLDGMYRADANHFGAQEAIDNAFREALAGGFGAYRMTTDYSDPYDPDDDTQRINPGLKIIDADQSVYMYGGIRDDGADAKAGFIITADLRKIAEDEWGAENLADWPLTRWRWNFEWFKPDLVYKAEYYEVEDTSDKLLIFTQQQSGEEQRYFASEIEEGVSADLKAQGWKVRTRPVKRKRVHKYIMNGAKVLKDCGYIAGCNIPIVLVYGRVDWVEGQPRYRGYIRKKKDVQRLLNTRLAKLAEMDSIAPFPVPIVAPEQMNPAIAEQWARGNIDRTPFRQLMPLIDATSGTIISAGPTGSIEPPQAPPVTAALLQISMQMLQDDDDSNDTVKANTSADAMDIAAARVDAKSGIYMDNLRASFVRAGEIYKDMAREIYYEPGRRVDTLTIDGQQGTAELHEPVMRDGIYKVRNDLSSGKFKVVASVGISTSTAKQKAVRQDLELIQVATTAGAQDIAQAVLIHALANIEGEGTEDLNRLARQKGVAMGLFEPTPEEAKQIQDAEQAKGAQPDPQAIALQTATQEAASKAQLNQAGAQQKIADARLKMAQADTLEKAPTVPTGLTSEPANDPVEQVSKLASARLNLAKAGHLEHSAAHQTIKSGADLAQAEHQREIDRRQQDLAERQAQKGAAE